MGRVGKEDTKVPGTPRPIAFQAPERRLPPSRHPGKDQMTDESQSFFTELLRIEADLPAFVASLQEIKQAYEEWADSLGAEVEQALSVGPMAGLKAALDALRDQVQLFNHEALAAAQNTQSTIEGSVAKQEELDQAASQR